MALNAHAVHTSGVQQEVRLLSCSSCLFCQNMHFFLRMTEADVLFLVALAILTKRSMVSVRKVCYD